MTLIYLISTPDNILIMIGWEVLEEGDYCLNLPKLSSEEQLIVKKFSERLKEGDRCSIDDIAKELGFYLDHEQRHYLTEIAKKDTFGYSFLDFLLKDPEIEEISVVGIKRPVYVYVRNKGWKKVNASFTDLEKLVEVVNKMTSAIGRHITLQNPRLDAVLSDGSRLHASLPPISEGELTIRKFREDPFSPKELINNSLAPLELMAFLSLLIQCDSNIIIAGNTGSGKTTTLNALFSFIPKNERILILEQTPEINIPHEHKVRLVANMNISLKDLIYDSLRMRPDRTIVGEVRSKEEVEALFDSLLSGQARGCYATFHAQGAKEAFARLRSYGIREEDLNVVDCVVVQRRMVVFREGKQEVRRIVEVANRDELIFDGKRFKKESALMGKIEECFGKGALEKRIALLNKAPLKFNDFYSFVQGEL